jgi:murein tripeptide amidase MpaA
MVCTQRSPTVAPDCRLFECGMHSREWISTAVCTYIAHCIVRGGECAHTFDMYHVHFVFVVNPDGYEYTWTHVRCRCPVLHEHVWNVQNRFWRKSRSLPTACPPECDLAMPNATAECARCCRGVDLNRNWNVLYTTDTGRRVNTIGPEQDPYRQMHVLS